MKKYVELTESQIDVASAEELRAAYRALLAHHVEETGALYAKAKMRETPLTVTAVERPAGDPAVHITPEEAERLSEEGAKAAEEFMRRTRKMERPDGPGDPWYGRGRGAPMK